MGNRQSVAPEAVWPLPLSPAATRYSKILNALLEQDLAVAGEVGEKRQASATDRSSAGADGAFDDGERRKALVVEEADAFARMFDDPVFHRSRKGTVDDGGSEIDHRVLPRRWQRRGCRRPRRSSHQGSRR